LTNGSGKALSKLQVELDCSDAFFV